MTDTPEFSCPCKVDALPPKGRTVNLDPGADELTAVAGRLGLLALNSLEGELKLRPEMGRQISLSGSIRAEIVQTCVVSGEPLTTALEFDLERTFTEDADPLAGLNTSDEDELTDPEIEEPDPIIDGRIDVGEHAVEELALNIPPYPRASGAVFEGVGTDEDGDNRGENPFAVLADLKDKIKSKD
ncbi:MAG: YceD family protein [Rhodospirillales bacterium]